MMDFVTNSQFESILTLRVILGIGIVYLMWQFAIRNPTDYDTPYRRKMRHVYGWICCAGAIGFIFLAVAGPFPFSLPWYYLDLYGTVSPSDDALLYGISSNMIVRAPSVHYVWGRLTFEQWAMCSSVSGVLEWAALAVYAFAMKRSSVKWFAKLRKATGYILLIILPAQVNNLHYFDMYELIPLAVYVLIVYLLVRTYKSDNKEPKLPEEAKYQHIQDFKVEEPEAVADIEVTPSVVKAEGKVVTVPNEDKLRKVPKCYSQFKTLSYQKKILTIILWVLCAICFVATVVFASLERVADYKEYKYRAFCYGFKYCEDYDVYLKDNEQHGIYEWDYDHVDDNLGIPIHPGKSLRLKFYGTPYGDEIEYYDYNQPMYLRCLNYEKDNNLGKSLFAHLQELGYPITGKVNVKTGRTQIIYWDKIEEDIIVASKSTIRGPYEHYDGWTRKHIIEEKDDKVYELIICMIDKDTYDNSIERVYSIENPSDFTPVSIPSKTWKMLYVIFAFIFIILVTCAFIVSCKNKENILNPKAFRLYKYMIGCVIIEYLIHIIVFLFDTSLGRDALLGFIIVFVLYLCILRIPTMVYVYKKIGQPRERFYLVPQWMQEVIKGYSETETPLRAALVFLLYPLFYLCTLPAGICVLFYLIPAIIIYVIVFFIIWVIKGTTKQINQ